MPIPKGLSRSPFEINKPSDRWYPDIEKSKKGIQFFNAPFVNKVRKEIYEWRQFGYDGISETSRNLLNYWFNNGHKDGFQYYFGQRESVESVVYLFENKLIRENKDLLKLDSWGISQDFINDNWLRFVLKQATGTGKTFTKHLGVVNMKTTRSFGPRRFFVSAPDLLMGNTRWELWPSVLP